MGPGDTTSAIIHIPTAFDPLEVEVPDPDGDHQPAQYTYSREKITGLLKAGGAVSLAAGGVTMLIGSMIDSGSTAVVGTVWAAAGLLTYGVGEVLEARPCLSGRVSKV